MSVAIVPMAREFGWTASVAGLVQSAFFWGYALSQIPGGYLTSRIGGRTVLPGGVGLWSGATAMLPLLASSVPGLCFSRAAVGLGEAMAPSAATDMVSRVIDNSERARAISFIFAGLHVGSLLGLLIAPVLIEQFGWYVVLLCIILCMPVLQTSVCIFSHDTPIAGHRCFTRLVVLAWLGAWHGSSS